MEKNKIISILSVGTCLAANFCNVLFLLMINLERLVLFK